MTSRRLKGIVENPILKVSTVGLGRIDLEDIESGTGRIITSQAERQHRPGEGVSFRRGDVLFGKLRPYLRKTWLADQLGSCSPELVVLRPRQDLLDARFLAYLVLSEPFVAWSIASSRGVKMPRTGFEALAEFRLNLPCLEQQRRIADALDESSSRTRMGIDHGRRLSGLLNERLRALRDNAFAVSADCARLKWFVRSISQGSSPQAEDRQADRGEWAVLKLSAVSHGAFRPDEHKTLTAPPDDPALTAAVGDLLVTRSNTPRLVGDCCVVEEARERAMLPDLIYRVRLERAQLLPQYAMHFLLGSAGRTQLEEAARGTSQSMVKLRGTDILDIRLPVPSIAEQNRIVRCLDRENAEIRRLDQTVRRYEHKLRERHDALITAAVTGQLGSSTYCEPVIAA